MYKSTEVAEALITSAKSTASCSESSTRYLAYGKMNHYLEKEYRWIPPGYVAADFPYDSYRGCSVSEELRVTTGSLSSISSYDPADAPYDTNKVLALPDTLVANTIYVQSSTMVNGYRVGGSL